MTTRQRATTPRVRFALAGVLLGMMLVSGCSEKETTSCSPGVLGSASCTTETENEFGNWLKDNWLLAGGGALLLGFWALDQIGKSSSTNDTSETQQADKRLPAIQPSPPSVGAGASTRYVPAADVRPGDGFVLGADRSLVVATHLDPGHPGVIGIVFEDGSTVALLGTQVVEVSR